VVSEWYQEPVDHTLPIPLRARRVNRVSLSVDIKAVLMHL
jgi:hypothetical protein